MDPFSLGLIFVLIVLGVLGMIGAYIFGTPLWLRRMFGGGRDVDAPQGDGRRPEHLRVTGPQDEHVNLVGTGEEAEPRT